MNRRVNKRENKKKRSVFLIISIALILIIVISINLMLSWYRKGVYGDFNIEQSYSLEVSEGDSFLSVINKLEEEGIIASSTPIRIYLRLNSLNPQIQFGTYNLTSEDSVASLIEKFNTGPQVEGEFATIKEGLRYEQIADQLAQEITDFDKDEFINIVENPDDTEFEEEIEMFINDHKPKGESLRGFLYPDTYFFDSNTTEKSFIELMLKNFIDRTKSLFEAGIVITNDSSQITTLYEGLILASIIEKEASGWDDRAEISGVFHNRLRVGMVLNSDATVNFFTGKNDAGITFADRDTPNPYNTYLNLGLPPTPINNPRIDSIRAALQPNNTPNFYFYHTPDGKTFYNETLSGHNTGVCRDLGC